MNQPNAWINYGAGMVYMKKKRYEAAGEKFQELLATHPQCGDSIAQLGIIEESHACRDTSKRYFEEVLNQDPGNEITNCQIGLLHLEDVAHVHGQSNSRSR